MLTVTKLNKNNCSQDLMEQLIEWSKLRGPDGSLQLAIEARNEEGDRVAVFLAYEVGGRIAVDRILMKEEDADKSSDVTKEVSELFSNITGKEVLIPVKRDKGLYDKLSTAEARLCWGVDESMNEITVFVCKPPNSPPFKGSRNRFSGGEEVISG